MIAVCYLDDTGKGVEPLHTPSADSELPGYPDQGDVDRSQYLPKVDLAPERVARTVAGLRPYRAGGFVVRAESLGSQRLVHNYGHGGAGITLSWGTSKLAVDLGLPGHVGSVAVLGAGAVGLSTARLVQEAGFDVTVYSKELPPRNTSNIAGGQWNPVGHFDESVVTDAWRQQYLAAAIYSWRRFQSLLRHDEYGVRWLPTYTEPSMLPRQLFFGFPSNSRLLSRDQHPFPVDEVVSFDTMYLETGRYLQRLIWDIQTASGRIAIRDFSAVAEIEALPEQLVFNCTGLGARHLIGDADLIPVRGQLTIISPQSEIRYAYVFQGGYMIPRLDGIVLGGTNEPNIWDTTPQSDGITKILSFHRNLVNNYRI